MQTISDAARLSLGFMSAAQTAALGEAGILVPDPHSTLVSAGIDLAPGVVIWPGTVLSLTGGSLSIRSGTHLYPGTRIVAEGGAIAIGSDAEIGEEGGFTVKAGVGSSIAIGSRARLLGGGSLLLSNHLGDGAQVLGPIRCQECRLGTGGSHREPDPDLRGGVLKGMGVARGIEVPQGYVVQAFGLFSEAPLRLQTHFHPKP
ncbi:hypothetical protein [Microvirga pudoricolor]|uniref:hypothetical protein n=1 Tax=Microvirga pudoricolor TaxID=2778729 RepID=UPI0019515F9B|nr:hypothetical protein [Microvirga pudoricolor]MBM6595837.1 hypothetical protein [Microvirga pudoricolor]